MHFETFLINKDEREKQTGPPLPSPPLTFYLKNRIQDKENTDISWHSYVRYARIYLDILCIDMQSRKSSHYTIYIHKRTLLSIFSQIRTVILLFVLISVLILNKGGGLLIR